MMKSIKHRAMPSLRKRGYNAAKVGRLTADWSGSFASADSILKSELPRLRARSRDLAMNDSYMRNFYRKLRINVVGHNGISLQMRVTSKIGDEALFDDALNQTIEKAWKIWGRKENCTMNGKFSWLSIQQLIIENVAKDGEVIVRKIRGKEAGNVFGFSLQVLEADHLDDQYDFDLRDGNYIRMGIEFNPWGRPIAYHILKKHPSDYIGRTGNRQERIRVLAEDILHIALPDRISQSRGVPWVVTAMIRLNMLAGCEEATLVALRAGASKMGFIISPDGEEYTGTDEDENGNIITDFESGIIEQLPAGQDFKPFDPQYPSGEFAVFSKSILRGVSAGIGMAYNSLASDLEGVNFSSIRQGTLEERDMYKVLQSWLIEELCTPVFEAWLKMALLMGAINLPFTDYDKLSEFVWRPRGWTWIDPLKDIKANIEAINNNLKSAQDVVSEQGMDIEDVYAQISKEKKLQKKYDLSNTEPLHEESILPTEKDTEDDEV